MLLAIVNPVTETAQRMSSLLRVIRDELRLPLDLVLARPYNPDDDNRTLVEIIKCFVGIDFIMEDEASELEICQEYWNWSVDGFMNMQTTTKVVLMVVKAINVLFTNFVKSLQIDFGIRRGWQ